MELGAINGTHQNRTINEIIFECSIIIQQFVTPLLFAFTFCNYST